ncbi:damage-control phosphatase ARMT1 family protein [Streptomyces durmitorensis]|uniref:Damage-control phosphatase ARMT1 family protein n=1 Tax=Streptomyces durmitorensis TaxID=319947 RepID=A0ABY4PM33_9ACTN|nr:damage-control phosphatase ARMT1 family protein [Streptomyces durmitorensis]UQT54126.1 damage-control phosphatase ARMT1 family protein [Streptomyces durmitorensis]
MPEAVEAPVILSNAPGSFPRSVLAERHPALIKKVRDAFPYGPRQHRALDALLTQATQGVIEPLGPDAHDRQLWEAWGSEYVGLSWFDAPFLWAESYFYRQLLTAVGYFEAGPWQGIDPFRPFKQAELHTEEADEELAALDGLTLRPLGEQRQALLLGSLWGNRADLGFAVGGGAAGAADSRLVADDSALLWSLLPEGGAATLCLVADNAGRELLPDLILVDHLLRHRRAERVVLHVKPYPYYVSDAMTADVIDCLRRLTGARGAAAEVGERLWSAMGTGQLTVRGHTFSCAPLPYADMPDDLRQEFAEADVTVMKGDLNYRRLVGDQLWPATTPFEERTAYFPGPVAALRTLKSDVIVGLDERTEAALVAEHGQGWRTSGTHALIQARR